MDDARAAVNEFDDAFYNCVFRTALRLGLGRQVANDLALGADEDVRARLGGRDVYVPKVDREKRYKRIVDALVQGDRVVDIADRECLSRQTVYKIRAAAGI